MVAVPDCFGDIERVFPVGQDGHREVSPDCWPCGERIECLRQAVASRQGKDALVIERARREEESIGGAAGFFKRWSLLKAHNRRKER